MRVFVFLALITATAMQLPATGPVDEGKRIYADKCASCHGPNGKGSFAPALTGNLKHGTQPSQIAKVIRSGVPGTPMPAFKLAPATMNALTGYLASLRQRQ
jgi:cytochrome c oxidase cbb3-type subunit 3